MHNTRKVPTGAMTSSMYYTGLLDDMYVCLHATVDECASKPCYLTEGNAMQVGCVLARNVRHLNQ